MVAATKETGSKVNQSVKASKLTRTVQPKKADGKVEYFKFLLISPLGVMRIFMKLRNRLIFQKSLQTVWQLRNRSRVWLGVPVHKGDILVRWEERLARWEEHLARWEEHLARWEEHRVEVVLEAVLLLHMAEHLQWEAADLAVDKGVQE